MKTLWQDLRFGARALWKSPGFTLVAAVSLAVGIGANATIFSLVNAALLRPLPRVRDEARLADVNRSTPDGDRFGMVSYPDYLYLREHNEVFEGLAAHTLAPMSVGAQGAAERVHGLLVSGNYFDVLGVVPAAGRFFLPEEDRAPAGAAPVAVLSHRLWRERFGGGDVLGREVVVNGHPFSVVGVAPEGFKAPYIYFSPDVFVPLSMQAQAMPGSDIMAQRGAGWLGLRGRLKPGVTLERAEASLNVLAKQLQAEFPEEEREQGVAVHPAGHVPGEVRPQVVGFMATLTAVVGLVLLVACANVAGMFLARAARRRREFAVRAAMGATRWRVARQLLTESVLLFAVGGAFGVLLAVWMNDVLMAFKPSGSLAVDFRLDVDWRVLAFTLGVSLLTGVLFGLAPALQASKTDLVTALKDAAPAGGRARQRTRTAFVVAQIGISLVLLVGAALCVRSLQGAARIDPGFDPEGVQLASFDLALQGYDEARGREFYRRLKERVAALPGVEAASYGRAVQLSGLMFANAVRVPGREPEAGQPPPVIMSNAVDEDYLRALRVPLLAGRGFAAGERGVVVVNETMAKQFFGGVAEALGRRFALLPRAATREARREEEQVEVVGVARDGRYYTLGEDPQPFFYVPAAQSYYGAMTLHVRAAGGAGALMAGVREAAREIDPNVPLSGVMPLGEAVGFSLIPLRLAATVVGGLGIAGLLLAAIGVYGVVSYSVGSRTREIGIRVALGARPGDVLRLVFRQGVWMLAVGLAVGLGGAFALTRFLASLLYGVSATDPAAFASVSLLLAAVALAACFFPARRATKVDPMVALRHE
ncbi:MAG TPA: ABC transporter permease [Pyrinomonadaceae bacterium]|nr:ABC transporter permease [Pyrinomonadaceae bacterium]